MAKAIPKIPNPNFLSCSSNTFLEESYLPFADLKKVLLMTLTRWLGSCVKYNFKSTMVQKVRLELLVPFRDSGSLLKAGWINALRGQNTYSKSLRLLLVLEIQAMFE